MTSTTNADAPTGEGRDPIICSDSLGSVEHEASSLSTHQEGEILDRLVEQASRPTLASLFKSAIKSGVIKPTAHYHN